MRKARILSLLLALALVLTLLPVGAAAKGEATREANAQKSAADTKLEFQQKGDAQLLVDGEVPGRTVSGDGFAMPDPNAEIYVIVEMKKDPLGLDAQILNNAARRSTSELSTVRARDAALKAEQLAVVKELKKSNAQAELIHSYTAVLNGFAAKIKVSDIAGLKENPLVEAVYVSARYEIPSEPNDASSNSMIYAPATWAAGYDGDGMLIAVVDTGVDYKHELLSTLSAAGKITKAEMTARVLAASGLNATGSTYYKNDKVIFGYDYADNDEDPMDSAGHGTHVAGIAAANVSAEGVVMGVAPNAQLMALKVFSDKDEGAYDHDVVAAVDDAVKLGADAINLSLGFGAGFTEYPGTTRFEYTRMFSEARASGTFVSTSAGNETYMGEGSVLNQMGGPALPYATNPDYGVTGSPGTDRSVVATASVDNELYTDEYILLGEHKIFFTDTNPVPFPYVFHGQTLEYAVVPGHGAKEDFAGLDLTGKVALISRGGGVDFVTKAAGATAAGAIAAIVYDNVSGALINMVNDASNVPSIFVSDVDGALLLAAAEKKFSVSRDYIQQLPLATGGLLSSFSSFGVTPDLKIKPDITAPGGSIYSTVPGGYGDLSGTSMASPHVAGASALVKQRVREDFPELTPAEQSKLVENLLMSAALPSVDEEGYPYLVEAQGSGVMDVQGAVSAQAIMTNTYDGKSKVELGDKLAYNNVPLTFEVRNISAVARTFAISIVTMCDYPAYLTMPDSTTLNVNTATSLTSVASASVTSVTGGTFTGGNLTVPAGATATFTVRLTISASMNNTLLSYFKNGYYIEGYVFAAPADTTDYLLSIPFLGFVGDWLQAPAFDSVSMYDSISRYSDLPFYWDNAGLSNQLFGLYYAGVNGYIADDNIAPADHVAFSPNGDFFFDMFSSINFPLRNLRTMWVEITDASGNLVKKITSETAFFFYKSFFHGNSGAVLYHLLTDDALEWYGDDENGNIVPDGVYTYSVCALLDYPGAEAKPQKWNLKVTVDTQRPTYDYQIAEEDGRTLLTVNYADDHYLQFVAFGVGEDELEAMAFMGYKNYTNTYDVTEYVDYYGSVAGMLRQTWIYMDDYASNFFEESLAEPKITGFSFDASIVYLVEGAAARIPVQATGENLNGAEILSCMWYDNPVLGRWEMVIDPIVLENGKGALEIPAGVLKAGGTYTVDAWVGDYWEEIPITVVTPPADLWKPSAVYGGEDTFAVLFAGKIALVGASVTVNGVDANVIGVGADGQSLIVSGSLAAGDKIAVKGIKYYELYPSYVFNFNVSYAPSPVAN